MISFKVSVVENKQFPSWVSKWNGIAGKLQVFPMETPIRRNQAMEFGRKKSLYIRSKRNECDDHTSPIKIVKKRKEKKTLDVKNDLVKPLKSVDSRGHQIPRAPWSTDWQPQPNFNCIKSNKILAVGRQLLLLFLLLADEATRWIFHCHLTVGPTAYSQKNVMIYDRDRTPIYGTIIIAVLFITK